VGVEGLSTIVRRPAHGDDPERVKPYEGRGGSRFDRVGFKPDPIIN